MVVLLAAAAIVIVGLRLLGRLPMSGGTEVSESLWLRRAKLDAEDDLLESLDGETALASRALEHRA